jgi:uncharacterized oxidoreductase
MRLTDNTFLITGGSSGIGMALAERLLELGNEVIVTARGEAALQDLKRKHPALHIKVSDAGSADDRRTLVSEVTREFPRLNVLINNAGIQRKVDVPANEPWEETGREIDINLAAPIHMSALLIPHLSTRADAHIVNITSGLAFVPIARMPVYCATKAALHSFTLSLREQLKTRSITVTEVIPPAVKTNLGGSHDFGAELDEFTASVLQQLRAGIPEVTFGASALLSQLSRSDADDMFRRMNGPL